MNTQITPGKSSRELSAILKNAANLAKLAENCSTDYWNLRDAFVAHLRDFVSVTENLANLNANGLLEICSLVSVYRPVALHTFLIYCSKANDLKKSK